MICLISGDVAQDYIKKLEKERFESDLEEAQKVLSHMGSRLQTLEHSDHLVAWLIAQRLWCFKVREFSQVRQHFL